MTLTTTSPKINRRAILAGSAIALPALVTMQGVAAQTDPHPEWLARWKVNLKAWEASEEDTPEDDALKAEYYRLVELLAGTPAYTAQGLAAQFEWFNEDLGAYIRDSVCEEHACACDILQAGINRLAGAV